MHCIVSHKVCSFVGKCSTSVSSPSGQTENNDSDYDSAYDSATFTDMVQYKYILNAQNKDTSA